MGKYPKTPYPIIVEGNIYFIHEQEKNRFFVTHKIPHGPSSSIMEAGIFVISPKNIWHVKGGSDIDESHRIKIFQAIESLRQIINDESVI